MDGTLSEAWGKRQGLSAEDGSCPPADGGRDGEQDTHGQQRSDDIHASTTDPDARLYRKGRCEEAKLRLMGHALMGEAGPWPKTA